ncbi:Similar to MINPP1: Multiple inositol polyphosphate phosphatase 1 (Pongo abelii) [Cotesia congregata]|uniref:Multiple inositol polyphosphate phosphatase 1 n=1 Tax=Cotesia congregata TaxID=51543 RepID=A0A8J2H9W5_COTCN|nr:Similar to MINPP1: Multiple inositol polyphosphate phosphatase 1 (Pongo abelii) [Cotesia congregata]
MAFLLSKEQFLIRKRSNRQRTKESAGNFTIGLFGKKGSSDVEYPPVDAKDRILRFYKACDKWQRDVDDNLKAYAEVEKFSSSPVMIQTLKNLSNRLGVTVDFDKLKSIRATCAFETAWNENSKSPWCELLSPDEFLIMEFSHDLKYYWIDGYGYPLTYQHACTAIGDMFKFLKDPNPLLHDSYNSSKDRLWRVSLIDAFASNLAFVSYDCQSQEPIKSSKESVAEENKKTPSILVMHQERIVNLPGCPKNSPCPLAVMQDKYPDEEDECQFEKICRLI